MGKGITYSGLSIVKNPMFTEEVVPTSFFKSVAHPVKRKVNVYVKNLESIDFGSAQLYYKNLFRILKDKSRHPFFDFLCRSEAIDLSKLKHESYGTGISRVINLSNLDLSPSYADSIVILPTNNKNLAIGPKIIKGGLIQRLEI